MTDLLWDAIVVRAVPMDEVPHDFKTTPVAKTVEVINRPIVTDADLSRVAEMQKNVPPTEPERERQLEILRAHFKLVHFSVLGYKLENRTLALPTEVTELLGSMRLEINQYLRTSWRLFADDAGKDLELQAFETQRHDIEESIHKYLKPLGHFGKGLLVRDLDHFENDIQALENVLEEIKKVLDAKLPTYIDESRKRLVDFLLERAQDKQITLPEPYMSLFEYSLSPEQRQRKAAEQVADVVDWPAPAEIIEHIQCQHSISDVTLDHLQQESFRKAFRKAYRFDIDRLTKTDDKHEKS